MAEFVIFDESSQQLGFRYAPPYSILRILSRFSNKPAIAVLRLSDAHDMCVMMQFTCANFYIDSMTGAEFIQ